jgi:teichoic acid transport system permease protein
LLPISLVISNLLTFVFELIILAVVAVLTGEGISSRWLALPVIVLIQSVLNLGGAFVAARLNDSFRDVQQIIPFLFRLLMYASGVMFDIRAYAETGPAWVQTFVRWNPMVEVVELYRWVFLGSAVDGGGLLRLVVVASVLLVVGFRFFRAAELRYGRA